MVRQRLVNRGYRLLMACLVAAGFWQIGQAGYLYLKAGLAQHLLQRAWTRTLQTGAGQRPWPWADTWPVARLRWQAGGIDLFVLADASGRSLAFGPGVVNGAELRHGTGNRVIAGHRDSHFQFLGRLNRGDVLQFQNADGEWNDYRLLETAVVDSRKEVLIPNCEGSCLTLVTCFPFNAIRAGGPLRFLALLAAGNTAIRV
jgi:sortase A